MVRPEIRFYRRFQKPEGFTSFEIAAGESDLWIAVPKGVPVAPLREALLERLLQVRAQIEEFGRRRREFITSLEPVEVPLFAPAVVRKMASEAARVGVGPMAGVAGAINFFLADLFEEFGAEEFIVENGGDVYVHRRQPFTVALFPPGAVRLTLGLELPPGTWGISTSSRRIGHSLSLGNASLATAVCPDPVLSDCCATYLGNSTSPEDARQRAERLYRELKVCGVVLIEGKFVIAGDLRFVKLV